MEFVQELRRALRQAVREQLGAPPYDRTRLQALRASFSALLENATSPNHDTVSDVQFRSIMAAELHEIFNEAEQIKQV